MIPADWAWLRDRGRDLERMGRLVVALCEESLSTKREATKRSPGCFVKSDTVRELIRAGRQHLVGKSLNMDLTLRDLARALEPFEDIE